MSSLPTAQPGPGGLNNPVGEALLRPCPGALGKSTEPQWRRVAKMEVRKRGPHRRDFPLTGPAPGPWGPWLFLRAPNYRAGLKPDLLVFVPLAKGPPCCSSRSAV